MIICGKKEYIYESCVDCNHASFAVVRGLHPNYGYWIQTCELDECKPMYNNQYELF